ncbi:MAG: 4-alpha-glucanotransferase [Acidobacteriaceae bacterium]|nr:4-alpha-glucanotransferase [Acidobacteriaceae bacterium]MBV9780805.1 4-alpha-glucanotransferase [Acidobacteriaceae bacterium]
MPARAVFQPSSSYEDALARLANETGIDREYWDILGKKHEASPEVHRRILTALGLDVSTRTTVEDERIRIFQRCAAFALPPTLVIGSEKTIPLSLASSFEGSVSFEILLETGGRLAGQAELSQLRVSREFVMDELRWYTYDLAFPRDVPLGYHELKISLGGNLAATAHLIVGPDRAYLPESLASGARTAGLNVALYGLRSDRNWGCGDFSDLHSLIDWAATEFDVSFIGLNPLHALYNRVPYNTSPYLPLSIFYKNPIYIDVESVPEFKLSLWAQRLAISPPIQESIRKLREAEFVQYEQIDQLKRRFLKVLFREFRKRHAQGSPRAAVFAEYCDREGDLLEKFALYCAFDEILHRQNPDCWNWRDWPEEYQSPESDACRAFAKQHPRTIEFYKYVQFVLDEQLSAANTYARQKLSIGLYHDLALATDNCGSDLWAHRNFYVPGCRVGAPPDDFSPNGQDWAFPPPRFTAHRENGYRLYRESIRKVAKCGGALRIDHVMRLFRLFWIPEGVDASEGIYVRENAMDLMRILALESVRNKNVIVGEDLGTVTDEIRDMLSRFGILSYRLFYFEKHRDQSFKGSGEYPRQALVSSTTHDLPTLAGFWTSRDIEARKSAGLIDEGGYRSQLEDRKRDKQSMLDALHAENLLPHWYPRSADRVVQLDGDLHNAIIAFLAQVPSMILLFNQEDFTKETEQQNLPGSTAEYPNWQRKMKAKIEDLRSPEWQPYAAMLRNQLHRTGRALH